MLGVYTDRRTSDTPGRMNFIVFTGLLTLIISSTDGSQPITCLDNNGSPVDWFAIYKLPEDRRSSHPLVKQGLGHFYLDVNNQEWKLGEKSLNGSGHALYYTMKQAYDGAQRKDIAYLFYNDEKPSGPTTFSHGHTKGDVVFDSQSGFWLVHSVPHFPPMANESYGYPHTGRMYGQSFLCVTYAAKYFDQIGIQMLYNYPWVYDSFIPDNMAGSYPNLVKVTKDQRVEQAPWNHQVELVSQGGQSFISFAKYVEWDEDLYDAWIAPYFGSEVHAETWQNGRGKLPSNCTAKYPVLNIRHIQIQDVSFKETKDHSKWALTTKEGNQWICIGDINRAEEQKHRAGGTVCSKIPGLWKAFNSAVTEVEKCGGKSSFKRKYRPTKYGKQNDISIGRI